MALIFATALSSNTRAELLTQFRAGDTTTGQPIPAHDWVSGITNVSNIIGHGTVVRGSGATPKFQGWANTTSSTDYVGFTLFADPGVVVNFQNITHGIGASTSANFDLGSWNFGYRVDPENDGVFGAWVFTTSLVPGDAEFTFGSASDRVYALNFSTPGAVEFGVFGTSGGGLRSELFMMTTGATTISVNGSITAVPEPSDFALGIVLALVVVVVARRRKSLANS